MPRDEDEQRYNTTDAAIPDPLRPVMNGIGTTIERAINGAVGGPGRVGFVLFTFDYGPGGTMSYISNGQREDVLRALGEFITRNAQ